MKHCFHAEDLPSLMGSNVPWLEPVRASIWYQREAWMWGERQVLSWYLQKTICKRGCHRAVAGCCLTNLALSRTVWTRDFCSPWLLWAAPQRPHSGRLMQGPCLRDARNLPSRGHQR